MKKRIIAVLLVVALMLTLPMSAFAAKGFDVSVFEQGQDITVEADDMEGTAIITSTSLFEDGNEILLDDGSYIWVWAAAENTPDIDFGMFAFTYVAKKYLNVEKVIIKVGDNRYFFEGMDCDKKRINGSSKREMISFFWDSATIPFMEDLIEHRDEEIKVRLCGKKEDVDFVLTKEIKDSFIHFYNLFVMAGGTRPEAISIINLASDTTVKVTSLS